MKGGGGGRGRGGMGWLKSIMSVQKQCKSSLNQKTERKIEWLENNGGGGKNGPDQSFPTPLLRRNMQLAKSFLNLIFFLG